MQIRWNFFAKATHIFSAKNIGILYSESAKTVNEMTLNELVNDALNNWAQGVPQSHQGKANTNFRRS